MIPRPEPGDYAPFFQGYVDLAVDRVGGGDVLSALAEQGVHLQHVLEDVDDARGDYRYAEGKWTIKRVVLHVADGERMFGYRAMCIARGDEQELPTFDENSYAANDGSDARELSDIVDEYASVRAATLTLFHGFDDEAWRRRGRAGGAPLAVRALPWIVLGHDLHHHAVLRERYGLDASD